MAYWIQKPATNENNSGYRFFYCEEESDVANLPTSTQDGVQQENDTVSNKRCAVGSEACVISTGNVYVLQKTTDTWEVLGG